MAIVRLLDPEVSPRLTILFAPLRETRLAKSPAIHPLDTIVKKLLKLKVTDMHGNRIGFGNATGRYFGKILSGMICFIGFIMVAFTEKKQGLHDMMAGTLVIKDVPVLYEPPPPPDFGYRGGGYGNPPY